MRVKIFNIDIYVKRGTVAGVGALIGVILGILIKVILFSDNRIIIPKNDSPNIVSRETDGKAVDIKVAPTQTPKPQEDIKVYVIGCVVNPGIVTIKKGQIVQDVLELAGGLTGEADHSKINKVYKLNENTMLYVKPKSELEEDTLVKQWSESQEAGPGVDIINDSGGAILSGKGTSQVGKKININKANISELDTLPGIGEETAKVIIEFRNKNGDFKTCNDLMKIPGIKESKYNKVKDLITVD